ncbi:MAG: PAS domain-containing protein [Anaerolineales bacterium]|nr:PAS domain-containing protein [Anaerolineales bacterium]
MQLTPYLIPWVLSALLTFSLGLYALRFRKRPAAIPFIAMCFFASFWAFSYLFDIGSTTLAVKIWGIKFSFIGILGVPLSWTAFALAYSGHQEWLTRRNIFLASVFPILTLIVIFTNEAHGWFFAELSLQTDADLGLVLLKNPLGWWFWLHAAYLYIILLIGAYFLLREYWENRNIHRSQIIVNIIAIFLPWIVNGMSIAGLFQTNMDITSITFSISILILGWGFLRYRLLDITPIAHRIVFESMPESVIVLDANLLVIDVNSAALNMFQLEVDKILGKPFQSVFHKWIPVDNAMLHTDGYQREIAFESDNQPVRWLHLFINALRNKTATDAGHIVTLRDVTSIKENEAALAVARDEAMQANNFKTQLLANVSHELRTPLSVILGYTDLLMRKSYGDLAEKQVGALARIKDSAQHLNDLVSELLDQAQLDSGKLQLEERSFEPRELFGSVCGQVSVLVESKGLKFDYIIDDNLPVSIWGDSQRLKQILINLVGNAIKFTEIGGVSVRIAATQSNSQWFLQVSDTGTGISPEALESVFEPFRQLANAHKSPHRKGYGLGLSITKQFARLMGGDIIVESELERGTTFTVTLPLIIKLETEHE